MLLLKPIVVTIHSTFVFFQQNIYVAAHLSCSLSQFEVSIRSVREYAYVWDDDEEYEWKSE